MAHFTGDTSTESSDSESSFDSSSDTDIDINVVRPELTKSNEVEVAEEDRVTKKEKEGDSKKVSKEKEGDSKKVSKARKTNRKANPAKAKGIPKEKLTPERTVRFVKKIIQKHKKRATKDKKKLNNLLKMHNSEAEPILKEEVDAEFNNTLERVERAKFRFDESLTALHSLLGESLEKIHAKNASCFSGTSTVQTRRGVIEITSKT